MDDPAHFLSCQLLRPLARVRHDRLVRALATLIQRAGGAAYVEPRYLEDKRPDIHAFFPDDVSCWMFVFHTLLLLLVSILRLVMLFVIVRMPRLRVIALSLRILVVVLCLLRLSLLAPWVLPVWHFAGFRVLR